MLTSQFPRLDLENTKGSKAIIKTNRGDITAQLSPGQAPKTIRNFAELVKKGYYNGVIFHRVISDFMIRGGNPTGAEMGGESIYGEAFEDEFSRDAFNLYDTLSMANTGPSTNSGQLFIVINQNVPAQVMSQLEDAGFPKEVIEAYKQGGTPWSDSRHTVFGHVVGDVDVVDEVGGVQRNARDCPAFDAVMDIIEIVSE